MSTGCWSSARIIWYVLLTLSADLWVWPLQALPHSKTKCVHVSGSRVAHQQQAQHQNSKNSIPFLRSWQSKRCKNRSVFQEPAVDIPSRRAVFINVAAVQKQLERHLRKAPILHGTTLTSSSSLPSSSHVLITPFDFAGIHVSTKIHLVLVM